MGLVDEALSRSHKAWALPTSAFSDLAKRLLIVHNLVSGQSIIHEFYETDFAFELVDGSPETDENGELDVESKLFYRLD